MPPRREANIATFVILVFVLTGEVCIVRLRVESFANNLDQERFYRLVRGKRVSRGAKLV